MLHRGNLTSEAIGERSSDSLASKEKDAPAGVPVPRPAFFLRLFAGIVDLLILGVPLACFISFASVAMGISTAFLDLQPGLTPHQIILKFGGKLIWSSLAFFVLTSWVYFAACECSKWQATPGKKFLGLMVTDENGARASFYRASLRFWFGRALIHVPYVGIYYFLVDCGRVAFSRDGRAVHDLMAGCWVRRTDVELKRGGA
jgi:uncharacterized RDD family membrane protein YckC